MDGLTAGYLLQRRDDLLVEIPRSRDDHRVFRASLTGRHDAATPSFLAGAPRHLPICSRRWFPVREGVQA